MLYNLEQMEHEFGQFTSGDDWLGVVKWCPIPWIYVTLGRFSMYYCANCACNVIVIILPLIRCYLDVRRHHKDEVLYPDTTRIAASNLYELWAYGPTMWAHGCSAMFGGEARRAEGSNCCCGYPLHAALTTHHALQPLPLGRHGRRPLPPPRRGPVHPPPRLPFRAVGGSGAPPSTPLRASHRRWAPAPCAPADFEARRPAGCGDAGAPAAV